MSKHGKNKNGIPFLEPNTDQRRDLFPQRTASSYQENGNVLRTHQTRQERSEYVDKHIASDLRYLSTLIDKNKRR